MKARRISDGKVIEVQSLLVNSLQDMNNPHHCRAFIDTDGKAYDRYEIEIIPDEPQKEVDWAQMRYEIAKDCLMARISNGEPFPNDLMVIFKNSVFFADELIKQLKAQ